jgi:hypothetical protein
MRMPKDTQPLRVSPVSRNLETRVHYFGLEVADLMVIGFLSAGMLLGGNLLLPHLSIFGLPAGIFLCLAVIAVGVPGLMAFKYGKPRGYLKDLIRWHLKPRTYCPLMPDREITRPYIIETENSDRYKGVL